MGVVLATSTPEIDSIVKEDTKTLRKSKVVLFNDEDHTYDYVCEMLSHCCKISKSQAFKCAVEVDMAGKTIVYYGTAKECQKVSEKINTYGPDHRMPRSMGSMGSEVEGI